MRNGDYTPTRMEAQIDSANLICGSKTESHPENTVAVMTTAGSSPAVRLGLTTDFGKMMATLASIEIDGEMRFAASMRVARLVLKRFSGEGTPNRHIIAFVGSPIVESKEEMQKLGAELKKSNVAVDVVNFGEEQINTEKLEAFIEAVNKDDNSRLVTVPPGPHILSDLLLQSPIILGDQAAAAGDGVGAPGARGAAGDFSDIAEVDPELAEVLRQSLEEYNQQQARERAEQEGQPAQPSETTAATQQQQEPVSEAADVEMDDDEELRMALEMSRQETQQQQTNSSSGTTTTSAGTGTVEESDDVAMEDLDDDEQLRLALELSKQEASQSSAQPSSSQQQKDESIQDILQDEDYLDSVLDSLPGVNKEELKKQQKKKEDE